MDVLCFLGRYDPDPLRFYLPATAPETRDTELAWEDLVELNSPVLSPAEGNEPVATLSLRFHRFPQDRQCMPGATPSGLGFMLGFAYKRFDGRVPELPRLVPRLRSGQASGQGSGQALDDEDLALVYGHTGAIGIRSLLFPRLRSGQAVQAWAKSELPPGQALREPAPLFRKLDESLIEEEYARMGD